MEAFFKKEDNERLKIISPFFPDYHKEEINGKLTCSYFYKNSFDGEFHIHFLVGQEDSSVLGAEDIILNKLSLKVADMIINK